MRCCLRCQGLRAHTPAVKLKINKWHVIANRSAGFCNVWTAFSSKGVSNIFYIQGKLTAKRYRDEILNVALKEDCSTYFHNENTYIYQHDHCPVHTANIVTRWLQE